MKKITKGFTLIELLIVIALLGALAVALLAALDPLEQIKKGTDTGVRNTVAEISSAIIRYASVKSGSLPYSGTIGWSSIGTANNTPGYTALNAIIGAGELKADFLTLAKDQLDKIYIIADQSRSYVCFAPGAKAFRVDANTKFVTVGGASVATMNEVADCDQNGTSAIAGGASCYWCVR